MHRSPRIHCCLGIFIVVLASTSTIAQVVVATLPVGNNPGYAAFDLTRNRVYVANTLCGTIPCPSPGTVTVIDGFSNHTLGTVNVGINPAAIVVNSGTNKIYVSNLCGNDTSCQNPGTVTVIDGNTFATSTVTAGYIPGRMALNPSTNKIYVVNACTSPGIPSCSIHGPGVLTVIDGATLATQNVTVGWAPNDVALNTLTNTIYVSNRTSSGGLNGTITVIDGSTLATQSVDTGFITLSVAVNQSTNQIYATDFCGGDPGCSAGAVTVIDGATLTTQYASAGQYPFLVITNGITNKIYAANECGDPACSTKPTVSVIDGATLASTTLTVCSSDGEYVADLEVNTVTNKVYVPCNGVQPGQGRTVTVIDGATNTTTPVAVGDQPSYSAVDAVTNTVYVPNYGDASVSVIGGATKLQLAGVEPCRLVDTRSGGGPIQGGTSQSFNLPQLAQSQGCADLSSASAYSLNVTLVPQNGAPVSYLTMWPAGELKPLVSTMNSLDGRTKANAAIIPAGVSGGVSVFVTNTANVVIDIDAYFAPSDQSTLQFYPLPPCRVADTRFDTYPQGLGTPHLSQGVARDFPVLASSCIPSGISAAAYSFNFTAIPYPSLGNALAYLEVWPTDAQPPHPVSTLNNSTGTYVANAAIVLAGSFGKVTAFGSDNTDLAIDINGYFAAPGTGGLSLYPTVPCRVFDSRKIGSGQPFTGTLNPPVDVVDSPCGVPATAQAYVFNATVVPSPNLSYLTLWPDSEGQPIVSSLNAADGWITSNMAIVPNLNGKIDAYATGLTQLILDISSYFAP
ncbi:MAG TPA: YncE family protein [Candidatus Limnocylindrales bacterium]|nr:YncE family protein [Candidatus Limnocylindrales bacterium]